MPLTFFKGGFGVFIVNPAAIKTNQYKSYIVCELDFFPFADDGTDKIIKPGFEAVCGFPHGMVVLADIKVNVVQVVFPDTP